MSRNWDVSPIILPIILTLNPDHASAHYNLGIAYKLKGWNAESAWHFDRAYILAPDKYPEKSGGVKMQIFRNKDTLYVYVF